MVESSRAPNAARSISRFDSPERFTVSLPAEDHDGVVSRDEWVRIGKETPGLLDLLHIA